MTSAERLIKSSRKIEVITYRSLTTMSALDSQIEVEGLILDPGALCQVHREWITTLSKNVLYRKCADDSTVTGSCYICRDGWEIGDELVRLRCGCLHVILNYE